MIQVADALIIQFLIDPVNLEAISKPVLVLIVSRGVSPMALTLQKSGLLVNCGMTFAQLF